MTGTADTLQEPAETELETSAAPAKALAVIRPMIGVEVAHAATYLEESASGGA